MCSRSWCIVLLLSLATKTFAYDDSIVVHSLRNYSSVTRSIVSKSALYHTNVELSSLDGSKAINSNIIYTILMGSYVADSLLDSRYQDHHLDRISTPEIFSDGKGWFFNKIYDSEIISTNVVVTSRCSSSMIGDNSTIYHSRISESNLHHSTISNSNITRGCFSCNSFIDLSNLDKETSTMNSVVRSTTAKRTQFSNSFSELSKCDYSNVINSKLSGAVIVGTTLTNSRISKGRATESDLQNTDVSGQSEISSSKLMNSKVSNSKITNSVIMNSNVNKKNLDSVMMTNDVILYYK